MLTAAIWDYLWFLNIIFQCISQAAKQQPSKSQWTRAACKNPKVSSHPFPFPGFTGFSLPFFRFPSGFFFFQQLEKEKCYWLLLFHPWTVIAAALSSRTILVVYRRKNRSSVLMLSTDTDMVSPDPAAIARVCSDLVGSPLTAFWSGLNSWHSIHSSIFLTHFRSCFVRKVYTLAWTHF